MRGDLQINSGSAQSRPWSLSHVPAGEHQLVDNGVFHHRRSMGPSAPGAKTCSTCCSMVPSSLVPSKKIRASLTVKVCFNLHNMDKMSISNHVSAVGHSVLETRPLGDLHSRAGQRGRHIFLENDRKHSRLSHSLLLRRH